jgi:hypothetical protein
LPPLTDLLEEKLREVQMLKEDVLGKRIEELGELASQAMIVPAVPCNGEGRTECGPRYSDGLGRMTERVSAGDALPSE